MIPRSVRRIPFVAFALVALLFAPAERAFARWAIIADNAANPILVCTDGIIFAHARIDFDADADYARLPATQAVTFKAAFPVPPRDVSHGGYRYPLPGTIVADQTFTDYKFSDAPWGIDESDPPDGTIDEYFVYEGMSAARWSTPLASGDQVLLTFANFARSETPLVVTVSDCIAFSIDILPGRTGNRVDLRSNAPLQVALINQPGIDPGAVDPGSVRFGRTGNEAQPLNWRRQDVDRDGDLDLVFAFNIPSAGFDCGSTAAFLTAQTTSGPLLGADTLVPINCRTSPVRHR